MGALKRAEKRPDDVLVVRYEDLISCPFDQASRIENFCRLGVRPEVVERAVLDSRFSALLDMERHHGGEIEERTELRGVPGQWRRDGVEDELAPFLEESRETLSILGYAK